MQFSFNNLETKIMAMNGNGKALDANSLPVKEFDGIIIGGGGS